MKATTRKELINTTMVCITPEDVYTRDIPFSRNRSGIDKVVTAQSDHEVIRIAQVDLIVYEYQKEIDETSGTPWGLGVSWRMACLELLPTPSTVIDSGFTLSTPFLDSETPAGRVSGQA